MKKVLAWTAFLFGALWGSVQAADADAGSGTLVLKSRLTGERLPAPLVHTHATIRVTGAIARVQVAQEFSNPHGAWYEGKYVFPLPENAAVDALRMRVGERLIEGVVRERQAARAAYEGARDAGQRATLVEQERPNIFTSSVANIGPGESIRVEIEYQHTVHYDQGSFSLRFPLVVGPRYIPGGGAVSDAQRITPPVPHPRSLGGRMLNPVAIEVELDAGMPLDSVTSAYHEVRVEPSGYGRARVALAAEAVPADRDFELSWRPTIGAAPRAAVFEEERNGRRYALLMVLPPVEAAAAAGRLPREAIFVIDTSGSMHGASIEQARGALALALRRLSPHDRFNVIEFNSATSLLFPAARPASADNLARAETWVRALTARGGTEMAAALHAALDGGDDPSVLRQVVFLTDGAVGNEEQLFSIIRQRLGGSRLFTVGIGSAPNGFFMTKAAQMGRGSFTYIGSSAEIAGKMGDLFGKLEAPVIKNLAIDWPGAAEAWPGRLPDLYRGEPIVVTAALEAPGGAVRIRGTTGAASWEQEVPLAAGTGEAGIGKLWARAKIASLMDRQREGADPEEIRQAVTAIALEHRLVSKFTSLVAIDVTPARPADAALESAALPTNLPAGWVHEAVFGQLPQTATPAALHFVLAAVALLLALVAWLAGAGLSRR